GRARPRTPGDARVRPWRHRQVARKLPYRFAAARHRRIGHRGHGKAPGRFPGRGEDAPAPGAAGAAHAARPALSRRRGMTCQEMIDFLMDYLDEVLAAEQRQVFEAICASAPSASPTWKPTA